MASYLPACLLLCLFVSKSSQQAIGKSSCAGYGFKSQVGLLQTGNYWASTRCFLGQHTCIPVHLSFTLGFLSHNLIIMLLLF